MFCELLLMRIM